MPSHLFHLESRRQLACPVRWRKSLGHWTRGRQMRWMRSLPCWQRCLRLASRMRLRLPRVCGATMGSHTTPPNKCNQVLPFVPSGEAGGACLSRITQVAARKAETKAKGAIAKAALAPPAVLEMPANEQVQKTLAKAARVPEPPLDHAAPKKTAKPAAIAIAMPLPDAKTTANAKYDIHGKLRLGCAKCRFSANGCGQCRNESYAGKRRSVVA